MNNFIDELKQFQVNYLNYINTYGCFKIDEVFLDFVGHPEGKILVYKRKNNKFYGPAAYSVDDIRGLNKQYGIH